MTYESVAEAIAEAERFLKAARAIQWSRKEYDDGNGKKWTHSYVVSAVESAAARRRSMDLTRALARMRSYRR